MLRRISAAVIDGALLTTQPARFRFSPARSAESFGPRRRAMAKPASKRVRNLPTCLIFLSPTHSGAPGISAAYGRSLVAPSEPLILETPRKTCCASSERISVSPSAAAIASTSASDVGGGILSSRGVPQHAQPGLCPFFGIMSARDARAGGRSGGETDSGLRFAMIH